MSRDRQLELSLHGPFRAKWSDGAPAPITGTKERGLIAMLALAADGVHSRRWLSEMLWNRSDEGQRRTSLRRLLADLRKKLGADFDEIFEVNNVDVMLRPERISVVTSPADGTLLEGLHIPQPPFESWLADRRRAAQESALGSSRRMRSAAAPSIAVLPFDGMTGVSAEAHFGDMVAQEISRSLSRSHLLEVISHLSSRRFRGREIGMDEVRRALNCQYAVHGTVFLDNDRYRLDAECIDVGTGRILRTMSFNGTLAEILGGGSETVLRIAQACGQEILRTSIETARTRPLPMVESHALFMAAIAGIHTQHKPDFIRARHLLEELIHRLPNHSVLHAWLAKWHVISISQGWIEDVAQANRTARDHTRRALDIDPDCATSLTVDGMIHGAGEAELRRAARRFETALEVEPNQAMAWLMYSRMHSFLGNGETAVAYAQKALRLSPVDPHGYFFDIMAAFAHLVAGDYEEAEVLAQTSIAANPRHSSSYRVLAQAQISRGDGPAAAETVRTLLELEPNLTVRRYLQTHPAGKLPMGRKLADLLREAGVPA